MDLPVQHVHVRVDLHVDLHRMNLPTQVLLHVAHVPYLFALADSFCQIPIARFDLFLFCFCHVGLPACLPAGTGEYSGTIDNILYNF